MISLREENRKVIALSFPMSSRRVRTASRGEESFTPKATSVLASSLSTREREEAPAPLPSHPAEHKMHRDNCVQAQQRHQAVSSLLFNQSLPWTKRKFWATAFLSTPRSRSSLFRAGHGGRSRRTFSSCCRCSNLRAQETILRRVSECCTLWWARDPSKVN